MFQNIPPITRNLIVINVVVFILGYFLPAGIENFLPAYFPLSPNFRSWQIITHMFMHGGFPHLLFNMIGLWSFGSVLERALGEKKYLTLYFFSGLGAFILFNVWNYYHFYQLTSSLHQQGVDLASVFRGANLNNPSLNIRAIFGRSDEVAQLQQFLITPMVGASGAIFGVLAAFAVTYPNAGIMILFIPFPIKAKILFPIIIVGSIYLGFTQMAGDNVAHFAHLGGALVGYFLIKMWSRNRFRIQ
ncbi:rhomboid family intramembrane serine protease [Riemerella anatipestifer]|nr:rhomboid family intramembrane serine protease [Riemerella anatipestifer]